MVRWLAQCLALAGACVLTGLLVLTGSDPPILRPAVGIAFAALFVCGRRLWPGLAVAVAVLTVLDERTLSLPAPASGLMASLVLAAVYTIQSVVGVSLVRRFLGEPLLLLTGRQVALFLLIAGPGHTFVAPLLSGGFEAWLADVIGGLVFAPITLAVLGQPRAVWQTRLVTVALPLLAATGLFLLAVALARQWDESRVRQQLEITVNRTDAQLETDLRQLLDGLTAIRETYTAEAFTHPGSRRLIHDDLRTLRQQTPGLRTVGVDLIVPGSRRSDFERHARRAVRSRSASEFYIADHGPIPPRPAGPRPRYVVRYHVSTVEGQETHLGRDFANQALWNETYERAASTGLPAVVSLGTGEFLIVLPVYRSPVEVGPPAPYGFIVGVFDPATWFATQSAPDPGIQLALKPQPLEAPATTMLATQTVPLADHTWHLLGSAGPEYGTEHRTLWPRGVRIGGILTLALLAGVLLNLSGRTVSAMAARERAEHRLDDTLNAGAVGYWEWDPTSGTEAMTGDLVQRLGGPTARNLLDQLHPEDRDAFEAAVRSRLMASEPLQTEVRVVLPRGEIRWLAVSLAPAEDGSRAFVRGILQDVTERKRLEVEHHQFEENLLHTQRLESLGVLASGVAHDFNNLLTSILGNVSLLRYQLPPGSELHEFLRPAEKSAEHAAQLCRHLLNYAGRGASVRGQVDLTGLVKDSRDLLRLACSRKANLREDLASPLPPVDGDPGQLRQVLLNLVQNASEALGPDGGTVTIRTGYDPRGADRSRQGHWSGEIPSGPLIWLEVADTGSGMDEATVSRIFDPFFTTKFTGRGLGLAAVQGIVRGHGGAVRVISRPGWGTEFRVYLPVSSTAQPPPSESETSTPLPPVTEGASPRTALVADDEPAIRHLTAVSLRALGFSVVEASDGRGALELFTAEPQRFSVVVLDLVMPGLDGREVLAGIREVAPDIPVVLTSGFPESDVADLGIGETLHFLPKPFRPVDLTSLVRRVVVR